MCCKRYHVIFSTFSLKFKCKICVQKEVSHNFKKWHFGHMTSYELTHFKKMVRVWKTKSLLFCLGYDPLIVFGRQNHITFIFIKTMSHDLLVQMAYNWFIVLEIRLHAKYLHFSELNMKTRKSLCVVSVTLVLYSAVCTAILVFYFCTTQPSATNKGQLLSCHTS